MLDPAVLTIGFARRFATYKRATLVFRDLPRLKRILTNPAMPVQIVIAGKAHPKDIPGKDLIREIVQLSRDPELRGRVVFVEDYGIEVAGEMVQGVDLWLNTPRRGEEACGTSGMKASINGVLSLSILDGWFDEAAEDSGGWAIGNRDPYSPDRDEAHAAAIYSLLENEIVPLYYEEREEDVPVKWMERVKQMSALRERPLQLPAHGRRLPLAALRTRPPRLGGHGARRFRGRPPAHRLERAGESAVAADPFPGGQRRNRCHRASRRVPAPAGAHRSGGPAPPPTFAWRPWSARSAPQGDLEEAQVLTLDPLEQQGTVFMFGRDVSPANHRAAGIFRPRDPQSLRGPPKSPV